MTKSSLVIGAPPHTMSPMEPKSTRVSHWTFGRARAIRVLNASLASHACGVASRC
jgi:hypothetical protein